MVQLHLGSRGSDVLALQQKLKTAGFYSGSLDSSFGPQTLAALKAFQTKAKLKVDGWYGDQSAAALANWGATAPAPPVVAGTGILDPSQAGYSPSGMTGDKATKASDAYKAEMAKEDRTIAEAMNRRGIFGSGIMGENINDAATDLKKRMDQAWASAYARGYATNDEAALLGLTPGKALRAMSGGGVGGGGSPAAGTSFDADLIMKSLGTTKKAIYSGAAKFWDTNPYTTIDQIMRNATLSDDEKAAMIYQLQPTYGMMKGGYDQYGSPVTAAQLGIPPQSAQYWLQKWLETNRWYKNSSTAYPRTDGSGPVAPPSYNPRWEGWY